MAILGAHMSIAGGYYKAVEEAARCQCDCVQLFTKNNNQWRAKPITEADVQAFQEALRATGVGYPLSHSSYLINLASSEEEIWQKSVDAMIVELERATVLGIPFVVLHPGASKDETEEVGLQQIIRALNHVHERVPPSSAQCLLETTAGQGSCLGWKFEHLREIQSSVHEGERLGVCVDTCHIFAAGYGLCTAQEYDHTMDELDRVVGISQIKAIHLNDSKKELGSRVDRHEHIGQGHLGLEPFRRLLHDSRFQHIPMYLETPKGDCDEGDKTWDERNLRVVRELASNSA